MKKMIIVLSALMMAAPAMASKARETSLQGATFRVDTQTIFTNPAHIHANGQLLTFEFGSTANTGAPKAEGGIFRKESDMVYGVYLGHINEDARALASVPVQDNPVEVFFGKNNWGASVSLSNGNKKTTNEKETTLLGRFGVVESNMEYFGTLEVINKSENATTEYEGKIPTMNVGFEYNAGRFYYGAELGYGATDLTTKATNTTTDTTATVIQLSAIDRSLKTDARELYYGVLFNYVKIKDTLTAMSLPLVIGLETDINTWAKFRGSVQQNFLLGSTKNEAAATPADTIGNNTTVAVGVGLFHGGFTLDGTLAASANGNLNGNQVLSNASVTYKF